MPSYIEKAEQITLPVAVLHGAVAFPSVPINFEALDDASVDAIRAAGAGSAFLFLVTATEELPPSSNPEFSQLYRVGTVAKIKQMLRTPEGTTRVIAEGFSRAMVADYRRVGDHIEADLICKTVSMPDNGGIRGTACIREMLNVLEQSLRFLPTGSADLFSSAGLIDNPGMLADFIAANIPNSTEMILEGETHTSHIVHNTKIAEIILEVTGKK